METLCKANKKELSPYKSINDHIDSLEKYAKESTKLLLNSVCSVLELKLKKAHPDGPLIFGGKIIYNPRTGKPIKNKEWDRLEEAIRKFLKIEKKQVVKRASKDSYWLGSILKRMSLEKRKKTPLSSIDLSKPDFAAVGFKDYDQDLINVSERLSGIYIQGVNDKTRNKLQSIIAEGTKQKKYPHQVFQDLWDQEEDINRDWDRVTRTESAYNINNGYLITTLRTSDEEHVFMKGLSAPGACPYCNRMIKDQIVVLLSEPPKTGETVVIKGKKYIAIWPGKSNYGRNPKNYWTVNPMHPYCRCNWTEWYLELEKYLKGE